MIAHFPPPRCIHCGALITVSQYGYTYCPVCCSLQIPTKYNKKAAIEGLIISITLVIIWIITLYIM